MTPDPAPAPLNTQARSAVQAGIHWLALQWRGWRSSEGERLIFVAKCMLAAFSALWLAFRLGWGAAGVWAGYLPWMIVTGLFFLARFLRLTASRNESAPPPA